jgi:zinc ribbon protein
MTSSGTSTSAGQFFLLLSMVGAIAAVALARDTHPVALLLLSGAVVAAGLVGFAFHRALSGFFGTAAPSGPLAPHVQGDLERDKALALRSIKELEFDRAMGKVGDADFADLNARLRARALAVMEELERQPAVAAVPAGPHDSGHQHPEPTPEVVLTCATCQTPNDPDARFCKQCGAKL